MCKRIVLSLWLTISFCVVQASLAVAQVENEDGDPVSIEEIIVTAQKREQRTIDIPMSVFAVSGESLAKSNIRDMAELAFSVPGLAVEQDNPFGPGMGIITIRGVGNSRGPSSLVGVYLDEAAVAGVPTSQIDLQVFDLNRVEVLRGPQGTLYGEGSVGGTIRYITNDPDLTRFDVSSDLLVSTTKEGGENYEIRGVVNLPIVSDTFGIRVAGTYQDWSGWIDQRLDVTNNTYRSNINDNQLTNIRVKALWRPTEALDVIGTAVAHRNSGGGPHVVNSDPIRGGAEGLTEFSNPGASLSDSTVVYAVDPTTQTPFHDDYDLYSLTATYDFDFATLLLSTNHAEMELDFVSTQDLLRPDGLELLLRGDDTHEFSTYEIRLTSGGSGSLNWTGGFFYRDFENHLTRDTLLFFPLEPRLANNTPDMLTTSESWAAFFDVSYSFTDRLDIGFGLRHFEDDRVVRDNVQNVTFSGEFDALTPRVYVSYDLHDQVKIYASVAQGFRSGGFNNFRVIQAGGPGTYQPETLTAYELGTKMIIADGRLMMEMALYHSIYEDIQSDGFNTQVLSNVTSNIGEAEITGLEWSFNWRPIEAFQFMFNGNLVHTEIVSLAGATGTSHFVGDPLDYVPEHNFSIIADYLFNWSPSKPGFLRLSYNQQGVMPRTQRASGHYAPHGYSDLLSFLKLNVGVDLGNWQASFFADNALDEYGYSSPYTQNQRGTQPRRRTIGMKFAYSFD